MTQQTKPFIVANVRDIIDGWEHFNPEGYSFSKMVEMLNEKAAEFYQQEVAKDREKANKLVEALELLTNEEPEWDKANAIIKQSLTAYGHKS